MDLRADAIRYLKEMYSGTLPTDTSTLLERLAKDAWLPNSDVEKQKRIATALALTIVYGKNATLLSEARARLEKTARADAPRLFLELTDVDEYTDPVARKRRLSAWTIAVRHLFDRGIPPSSVLNLATKEGGIDFWSRNTGALVASPSPAKSSKKKSFATITIKLADKSKPRWEVTDQAALKRIVSSLLRNPNARELPPKASSPKPPKSSS